ncbi:MAG: hypothetical protein FD180_4086 [Planctomycetota bacterium]|nr:MAG: hypothetical protein FD180_4086 [Planctomycetota bacterium]
MQIKGRPCTRRLYAVRMDRVNRGECRAMKDPASGPAILTPPGGAARFRPSVRACGPLQAPLNL